MSDVPGGSGAAPARAALAGNPSDGYGGAVLAVAVEQFGARARATIGERVAAAAGEGHDLVEATIARFDRLGVARALGRPSVETECSIPRLVGLAGSSAIIIATLRALYDLHGVPAPEPAELAELALAIEVEDLGIAAGLQDRVTQAFGGLVFMEFSGPTPDYLRIDRALLPPLLLAWRPESAAHSGIVHGDLRRRFERGDPVVRTSMVELARAARSARDGLLTGDHGALRRAVDASFDARARMMALDPLHVEMVTCARAAGAAANYAGSGGAVVCVCEDVTHRSVVEREMRTCGVRAIEL